MKEYTNYILDFAKTILQIPSPSGFTKDVINHLKKIVDSYDYKNYLTKKGNLIIEIEGKTDYTLGVSGHVDTLGAMIRSINGDGTLKFTPIGGPIWPTLD